MMFLFHYTESSEKLPWYSCSFLDRKHSLLCARIHPRFLKDWTDLESFRKGYRWIPNVQRYSTFLILYQLPDNLCPWFCCHLLYYISTQGTLLRVFVLLLQ